MSDGPNSLESFLEFMVENKIDDDQIYSHLARVDVGRIETLLNRLEKVEDLNSPRGRGAPGWKGRRNALKGKIYEQIVAEIVAGVSCFESWTNVNTTTNEIDILIVLGPTGRFVPALRQWGTHCLAECKNHSTYVKTDWVSKLNTVMQTHGADVGLLISRKGIATTGTGTTVRTTLQILAAQTPSRIILALDHDDLRSCVTGTNFLRLISTRYTEARAGLRKLSLLSS